MAEAEMGQIADLIGEIVNEPESESVREKVRRGVAELADRFPLYSKRLKKTFVEPMVVSAE
jgi:glycine/serine hydroxymethyltransferase